MTTINLNKKEFSQMLQGDICVTLNNDVQDQLYEWIRKQIEHEDGLINQRLTWLLATQGFYFVAYASLVDKSMPSKRGILCVIAALGYFTSTVTFFSLCSAFKSQKDLRRKWIDPLLDINIQKNRKENYPQICFIEPSWYAPIGVAGSLPVLIMTAWAVLFGITIFMGPSFTFWHQTIFLTFELFYVTAIILGTWYLYHIAEYKGLKFTDLPATNAT